MQINNMFVKEGLNDRLSTLRQENPNFGDIEDKHTHTLFPDFLASLND